MPLTVTLASEFSLLVITGPNTGGKTVALKTIGLLSVMALSGLPVTAQKAEVPMYCSVFADIGDEQSIEQNLSTFSSHITRIARILEESDENTLVLLDELGSGTDPSEGAALGTAIIEDLSERKVPTVVTTHIGQLKQIAYSDRNVQNAGMEFDTETLRPLYRLTDGDTGTSKAVMISSRLGMPQRIIERSKALLEVDDVEQGELWKGRSCRR
ncbi:MAG: hypothetical protein U5N86_01270 [Planctomycetota bacterium]|nr:hypothetical protein [Planctomycetota bacterium]